MHNILYRKSIKAKIETNKGIVYKKMKDIELSGWNHDRNSPSIDFDFEIM